MTRYIRRKLRTGEYRVALAFTVLAAAMILPWRSVAAPTGPGVVVGIGIWSDSGRVSALEMVGLNPQPEPPSRSAVILVYTSGASVAVITPTCVRNSGGVMRATGHDSDGRWYQVKVIDNGSLLTRPDRIGVASLAHPPSPCSDPGRTTTVTAGDFIIR